MDRSLLIQICALLIAGGAGVLWQAQRVSLKRRVESRLASALREQRAGQRLLSGGQALWRRRRQERAHLAELSLLLRQVGWISTREQVLALSALAVCWLVAQCAVAAWGWHAQWDRSRMVLTLVMSGAGAGLLLMRWIRWRVARRAERMDEELLIVIPLLRILWDVGMSLESALRSLARELSGQAPEVVRELSVARAKIAAGAAREMAFGDVARLSRSEGFQDMMMVLVQVSETGGGLSGSLSDLAELMQDRRRTRLQEKVSRLSGRMSAVMMLLLFPALLLVLAGPGFLALVQALEAM